MKKVLKNQSHKQGPTGRANLFIRVFGKLRASYDYYKRGRTRNPRTCCAKVLRKTIWKRLRNALSLLREQDRF